VLLPAAWALAATVQAVKASHNHYDALEED
jgi:hypothetical protein